MRSKTYPVNQISVNHHGFVKTGVLAWIFLSFCILNKNRNNSVRKLCYIENNSVNVEAIELTRYLCQFDNFTVFQLLKMLNQLKIVNMIVYIISNV